MPNVTDLNVALDGKITFQLDDGTTKIVDLANLGSAEGVSVVDNLTSTSTTSALSANQGRILQQGKIDKISATTPRSVSIPNGVAWLNTGTSPRTVNISGGTVSAVYLATPSAPSDYVQQGSVVGNFTVLAGGQIKVDWSVQPSVTIS